MLRDGFSLPAVFTVVMVFVLLSSVALIINSAAARRSAANGMQTESA